MLFINIMDIIGTAAFAVSGVLVGIKTSLTVWSICSGNINSSGGGLIRDVIIGEGLPVFFTEPKYLITIVITVIFTASCSSI